LKKLGVASGSEVWSDWFSGSACETRKDHHGAGVAIDAAYAFIDFGHRNTSAKSGDVEWAEGGVQFEKAPKTSVAARGGANRGAHCNRA